MEEFYLSVSDLKNFRFGDQERTYGAIVDKGIPVDLDEEKRNSEILYEEFPRDAAVAGLVHDAAVYLERKEPDFYDLPVDVDEEFFQDFITGIVTGEETRHLEHFEEDRLAQRIGELNEKYGISPEELLSQEFYDRVVGESLGRIGSNRSSRWRDDWAELRRTADRPIELEKWVSDDEKMVRGKADIYARMTDGNQIREVKVPVSDNVPNREHEYQIAAYRWLMDGEPGTVLDYPLQDEQFSTEDIDPDSWVEKLEEDEERMRPMVENFVSKQRKRLEYLLERETGSPREGERVEDYRDRLVGTELDAEQAEKLTEKATRDAINSLEQDAETIDIVRKMLEPGEYTELSEIYDRWHDEYEKKQNAPLWGSLTDLYDAGVIDRKELPSGTGVKLEEEYADAFVEEIISEVNELPEEYTGGEVHQQERSYGVELDTDIFADHLQRSGWDIVSRNGELAARNESWRGDKVFFAELENTADGGKVNVSTIYREREGGERSREFFAPRHRATHLERSLLERIDTIVQRQQLFEDAAEEALESLEPENGFTDELQERFRYTSRLDDDMERQIDEIVDLYYPEQGVEESSRLGEMGDLKADRTIMPFSRIAEDAPGSEGLLPLDEALRTSATSQEKNRRNRLYLEHYLETLKEKAEDRDEKVES